MTDAQRKPDAGHPEAGLDGEHHSDDPEGVPSRWGARSTEFAGERNQRAPRSHDRRPRHLPSLQQSSGCTGLLSSVADVPLNRNPVQVSSVSQDSGRNLARHGERMGTSVKRVTMGGTEVVVTDGLVADLILEYARELGQIGRTDTITVPAALEGQVAEASMLLGPASQITVTPELHYDGPPFDQQDLEAVRSDLRRRIDGLARTKSESTGIAEPEESFVDFGKYDPGA